MPACLRLAALVTLTALPAAADLSPTALWADLSARLEAAGGQVDAARDAGTSEETVALRDLVLDWPGPGWGGAARLELGALRLVPDGAGGIAVTPGAEARLVLTAEPPGAPALRMVFALAQDAPEIVVRDAAEGARRRAEYRGETLALELAALSIDGAPVPPEVARLDLKITAPVVRLSWAPEGAAGLRYDLSAEALDYEIAGADPEGGLAAVARGRLDAPWRRNGPELRYSAADAALAAEGPRGRATLDLASGPGRLELRAAPDRLRAEARATAIRATLDGSELAAPVSAEIDAARLDLSLPVAPGAGAGEAALALRLDALTAAEETRRRIDPSGALPDDPGRLDLALSGEVTPGVSLYDPRGIAAALRAERPAGVLNGMRVDAARLEAGGAALSATGRLATPEAGTGAPPAAPEGEITLRLTGAEDLIAALVESGIIGWLDGAAARIALGYFTRPAEDGDGVVAPLVFEADGTIRAGGQRIR